MLCQCLHSREVWGVILILDFGEDLVGLAESDFGAELQEAGGEVVFRGERGGVKVENGLVLALVEGAVDVDEFWLLVG